MEIEFAGCSHVGRRKNNEDSMLMSSDLGLFVVADGMGGYEGGEVASRIVVDTMKSFFELNDEDVEVTWPFGLNGAMGFVENLVCVGLKLANREVVKQRRGPLSDMGSTVVVAAFHASRLVIGHVGDSRVYRLRGHLLEQLTEDHSLIAELRRQGVEKLPGDHFSHIITRAIGIKDDVGPEVQSVAAREGDIFLLCSDGLTDPLDDEAIAGTLGRLPPAGAVRGLVEQAYEAGGTDNITAVVISVGRAAIESSYTSP